MYLAGCGAFASMDSHGYGMGISTTEIADGYFSSLQVCIYPAPSTASISLSWARPFGLPFVVMAPSVGLEGLRMERGDEGMWYGVGGVVGVEFIPSRMFFRASGAGEGDFLWIYVKPYSAVGFDFYSGSMYSRYGVEAGFRVRKVYSW